MITINILNLNRKIEVAEGTSIGEVAAQYIQSKHPVVGAMVNNKAAGLSYRLFQPKQIEFFDISSAEGMRIYTRSVRFLLYVAVKEVLPTATLEIRHSVSNGTYCEILQGSLSRSNCQVSPGDLRNILAAMQRMVKEDLPFERKEIETQEALQMIADLTSQRKLHEKIGNLYSVVHQLNGVSAIMYGDLVPTTGILKHFNLLPFNNGLLLQYPNCKNPDQIAPFVKQEKMFGVFEEFDEWLKVFGVSCLAELNEAIAKDGGTRVLQVAEALHEKKIAGIADMIVKRKGVRFVMISGPSSSGKTTFSKRLAVQLEVNRINPVNLSIDDYFVNREDTPKDENGEYDFEHVDAIDKAFFQQQLNELLAGREIEIPKFNFKTGSRYFDGTKLKLGESDVLVIEGTHALTPELVGGIPKESRFGIYICPMASISIDNLSRIHTSENRLIRRMVRDYENRGYNGEDTLARWPSVRRGEDKYIYPNQEYADVMFNTALCYELSVLKGKAETILLEVPRNSKQYAYARRLLNLLSYIKPMKIDNIPPTSILREFLGGSSFKY